MKIYKYVEFNEPLNEKLLSGLTNFFKELWKKMNDEITRLENDPIKIRDYVANTILNFKNANSVFKIEYDNFIKNIKKNTDQAAQIDAVKNFVNEIMGPKNGVLGEAGINKMFNDKSMQGDKIKPKRIAIQFIINTARNAVTKSIAYNPANLKFERTEAGQFVDKTILKGLKAILPQDAKTPVNLPNVQKWIETNVFLAFQNATKAITEDQIKEAQQKGGVKVETAGTPMTYDRLKEFFDSGTKVIYLLKDKSIDEYDSKKPIEQQTDIVGVKEISDVEKGKDQELVYFKFDKGGEFSKKYDEIIGPSKKEGEVGANAQKAKEVLGKIANDEDKMGKVVSFAEFMTKANKDQIDQIDKIIGAGA